MTDTQLLNMFTRANCQILDAMKQDPDLVQMFNTATALDLSDHDDNSSVTSHDDETAHDIPIPME